MRNLYCIIILLLIVSVKSFSQGVTQSAEGKSTVLLDGSAISIDIVESELGFGWNNLNRLAVTKDKDFFVGAEIKVKNSTGLGNLFSNGSFVPGGKVNAYLGHYWSNASGVITDNKELSRNGANIQVGLEEFKKMVISKYYDSLLVVISSSSKLIDDVNDRNKELSKIKMDFIQFINNGQPLIRFHSIGIDENDNANLKVFRTKVKTDLKRIYDNLVGEDVKTLRRKIFAEAKQTGNSDYWRILLYAFGGVNAIGFNRFVQLDPVNFTNSFSNVNDYGGQAGLGMNYEYRKLRIGLTAAYQISKNNFNALSETEYVLRTENKSGVTSLISEENIKAYSGNFGNFECLEVNLDLIYNLSLNEERTSHLLLNPYLRGNWLSSNTDFSVNTNNAGLGLYFFKNNGAFLGGMYLELPDLGNKMVKSKPIENQSISPALNRLTFGITTKFSLNSIISW